MSWVVDVIQKKIRDKFCGSIKINFFNGGISNINIEESMKPPQQ